MRIYKFPKWLTGLYPNAIWDFSFNQNLKQKKIYLTFDDGPNIKSTPWILDTLSKVNAKATFFCLGKNLLLNNELKEKSIQLGHKIANHGTDHLKGYKTSTKRYVKDVEDCDKIINSKLFRPPYGKITPKQHRTLTTLGYKTVFWTHISYDFDKNLSSDNRIKKFKQNLKNGGIVVFHDSLKALPQLKTDLPIILTFLVHEGYQFSIIPE